MNNRCVVFWNAHKVLLIKYSRQLRVSFRHISQLLKSKELMTTQTVILFLNELTLLKTSIKFLLQLVRENVFLLFFRLMSRQVDLQILLFASNSPFVVDFWSIMNEWP